MPTNYYSGNTATNQAKTQPKAGATGRTSNYAASTSQQQPAQPVASSPVTATGQINTQAAPPPAAPAASGSVQPSPAPMSPYGAYPGRPASTVYQYQGSPLMDASGQAVMNALQSPVMNDQLVSQMKSGLQSQNARALQQMQQQAIQQNAAQGTFGSGAMAANMNRMADQSQANYLNAARDLDIQAALANRDDLYKAAGAGIDFTNANEGLYRNSAADARANYGMDLDAFFQNKGLNIQDALGRLGIDAENRRTNAGIFGDLLGYQGGLGQLGYQYTALNAAQQQALWSSLLGGLR